MVHGRERGGKDAQRGIIHEREREVMGKGTDRDETTTLFLHKQRLVVQSDRAGVTRRWNL